MSKIEFKKLNDKISNIKTKLNRNFFSTLFLWITIVLIFVSLFYQVYSVNNTLVEVKKELKELQNNQTYVLLELKENEQNVKTVTTTVKKNTSDIDSLLDKYARKYGVDKNLVHSVALVESGKNPNAKNGNTIGVMQVSKQAGKQVGITDIHTTEGNIEAGVKYLAYLKKKFGSDEKALSAYNIGETKASKTKGIPNKKYVNKVLGVKRELDKK